MRYGLILFAFFLFAAASVHAQEAEWQPIGTESFEAITSVHDCSSTGDGSLLLIRYPGAIFRSTDTGITWSVVYEGGGRLMGFQSPSAGLSPTGERSNIIIAYGDSGYAVSSSDSGRTWNVCSAGVPAGPRASGKGEPAGTPALQGVISYSFADSINFAVGEPGLIYRWDTATRQWLELHRAPYAENPPAPRPGDTSHANNLGAIIDYFNPAYGAIALDNRIYVTHDSGVTWNASIVPDSNSISSFFLLSDTTALIGMKDGKLYYKSNTSYLECDSILYASGMLAGETSEAQPRKSILQIGWKDSLDNELFVLTDSELYSLSADLVSSASYTLPLRAGERATGASFPSQYVGFLLTDSTQRIDTVTSDGRDTTLIRDTSYIYRSLDGGGTWALSLNNIPGLSKMFFVSVSRGFACGANGLVMCTYDSGSTWSRAWTMTRQILRDVRFLNDSVGYAVGDSGTVLFTYNAGRMWRPVPPEPLFMHPATEYMSIAFSNSHTVSIAAHDRGFTSSIKIPTRFQMHWRRPQRASLSVSARPDPTSGQITFDIRFAGASPNYGEQPSLKVCDLSGKSIYDPSSFETISTSEWSAETDLSFLQDGVYTALVSYAGQSALVKFLIEH